MWLYIAKGVFIIALSGIIYLMIRTYPLVREQQESEETNAKKSHVTSDTIYAFDKKILVLLEKGLRKARVAILKIDHLVSKKIDGVKKKSEAREKNSLEVFAELEKKNEEKTESEE